MGTARFGLGYGLFSESNRINDEQLAKIFSVAKQYG